MLVANIRHCSYHYSSQDLLIDINFTITSDSKIGIIGNNGCGKSTLFKLLRGLLIPLTGTIEFVSNPMIGYLPQQLEFNRQTTVMDYCWQIKPELACLKQKLDDLTEAVTAEQVSLYDQFYQAGGYEYESEILNCLTQFEFEPEDLIKPIKYLSGGEQTKLGLCGLMLMHADLLLLDEPTNHLDTESTIWLENHLQQTKKPYLLISHDRQLLNSCANQILEIENGSSELFVGNYDCYYQTKRKRQASLLQYHEQHKKKLKQLQQAAVQREQWSKIKQKHSRSVTKTGRICKRDDGSLPASKERLTRQAAAVRARMKHSIEQHQAQKPFFNKQRQLMNNDAKQVKNNVLLHVKNLTKSYDDRTLYRDLCFQVQPGAGLAINGNNGCGKSTLLKILVGEEVPDAGEIVWSSQAKVAYYDQKVENLNVKQSVLQNCLRYSENETLIRTTLGQLFFLMELINAPIDALSPGERAKVALCCMLLQPSNVLILDEPCNHLEIRAREALQIALQKYKGSIVLVSHDRHFINDITDISLAGEIFGGY